jgi:hypothetical protein
MVRVIPGVSEEKARNLARHYSCPVALMEGVYENVTITLSVLFYSILVILLLAIVFLKFILI